MTRTARIASLSLAACLGLAACDGDSTGSDDRGEGSVRFSYSGTLSGSYSASGTLGVDAGGDFDWEPFAVGIRYFDDTEGEEFVDLFSLDPQNSTSGDVLEFYLPAVSSPTTLSLDLAACVVDEITLELRDGCALGFFVVDANQSLEGEVWITETGALRVDRVTEDRMRGSFSGTLVNGDGEVITVSGGEFDVPLVDEQDLDQLDRAPALNRAARPGARQAVARVLGSRR